MSDKEKSVIPKKQVVAFLLMLVIIWGLTNGCSSDQKTNTPMVVNSPEMFPTETNALLTQSFLSSTPTVPFSRPATNHDYDLSITLETTQGAVAVLTASSGSTDFLYKDTQVTVTLIDPYQAIAYLNLDDLVDNGTKNSDIAIRRTIGNEIHYYFYSVNNALYYYTTDTNLSYDKCYKNLSQIKMTKSEYESQEFEFTYGGSYCVLTNEGRIAIVHYMGSSFKNGGDFDEELSIQVTVFNKLNN